MYVLKLGRMWFNGFVYKHPGTEKTGHITPTFDDRHSVVIESDVELEAVLQELRKTIPMGNPIVFTVTERK